LSKEKKKKGREASWSRPRFKKEGNARADTSSPNPHRVRGDERRAKV